MRGTGLPLFLQKRLECTSEVECFKNGRCRPINLGVQIGEGADRGRGELKVH